LNLANGKSTFDKFEPGFSGDFPVIPQELMGYKTKYCYISQFSNEIPET